MPYAAQAELEQQVATLRASAEAGDQVDQAQLGQRLAELESSRAEIATLQMNLTASEEEFAQYRQQMADTAGRQSSAIENLRAAVVESRAERIKLEEQLSSAHQQLASAKTDLSLEKQRLGELQDELRLEYSPQLPVGPVEMVLAGEGVQPL